MLIVVPGFDFRWHWSAVPTWLVLAADALLALSFVIFFIVLRQNSYAASTIRVEADQPVVSTGLYAIVRHPLYSGALLLLLATPLALGSYWGGLVAFVVDTRASLATPRRGSLPETEFARLRRVLPRHPFQTDPPDLVVVNYPRANRDAMKAVA